MKRLKVLLLFFFLVTLSLLSIAQEKPQSLIKAGYFPYFDRNPMAWIFNLEYERNLRKAQFLSQGAGYDLLHFGNNFHILRYNIRFYPLYWTYDKKPYRGLYIGLSLIFYIDSFTDFENQYGLGYMPYLGAQFLIKNKFCLSFDANFYRYKHLNKDSPHYNGDQIYSDLFFALKSGILLGKKKN